MSEAAIELRPNHAGQARAYIAGTRIRVQDVYVLAEGQGQSPDEIARAYPHLNLAQIHLALAYYFDHRQEILDEIRQDEAFVARMRMALGPGPLEQRLSGAEAPR
jgi:uncharacterized protein (DUF433 family)